MLIFADPPSPAVARFARNERGRDFVVGDIHGMFPRLEALLDKVGFAPEHDRLFSVGDLVDRGPASREALRWLELPWFNACRGNHEQFAIEALSGEDLEFWVRYNGGEWWLTLSDAQQQEYREAFLRMPLAMEVETLTGLVGIVHADVPPVLTWEHFVKLLRTGHEEVVMYALFSRNRIHGVRSNKPVKGEVSRVYCGHTPVRDPVHVNNVCFIDTGAVYAIEGYQDAKLTLVEIHPQSHQEHFSHATPGD